MTGMSLEVHRQAPPAAKWRQNVAGGTLASTSGSGYAMHYFTTNHLGSTRLVTDASGSVREQFDYLPFGELCQNSGLAVANQAKTDYLYTGKELQQFFGINWYDSFARFQTTSGVFSSPDPLCEKYYSVSPYVYCKGNPIRRVDPDGMTDWDKVVGFLIGTATNIIPGTGFARDLYQPEDKSDYNQGLKTSDDVSEIVGKAMVVAGGTLDATGGATAATGALVSVSVVGAPAGTVAVVGGVAEITTGETLVLCGSMMLANMADNAKQGYNRGQNDSSGNSQKTESASQIQLKIKKGQAPKSFKSAHNAHTPNGQEHIHMKNGSSFNKDGSLHDKGKYKGNLTNEERRFIREQGWTVPTQ